MLTYIVRRLFGMIPTLFVVSMLTFIIIQLPPGDFLTTLSTQAAAVRQLASTKAAMESAAAPVRPRSADVRPVPVLGGRLPARRLRLLGRVEDAGRRSDRQPARASR